MVLGGAPKQIDFKRSPLAYFAFVLCPFCTMEYKSPVMKKLSFKALKVAFSNSNTLSLRISHTHFQKGVLIFNAF